MTWRREAVQVGMGCGLQAGWCVSLLGTTTDDTPCWLRCTPHPPCTFSLPGDSAWRRSLRVSMVRLRLVTSGLEC